MSNHDAAVEAANTLSPSALVEAANEAQALNENIYEYLDNGGNVQDDIEGMSLDEMEEYFGDLDPSEFL